jgi:hypothetical protein
VGGVVGLGTWGASFLEMEFGVPKVETACGKVV